MDLDDRTGTPREFNTMSMAQTLTTPLNNTIGFLGIENNLGQTTVDYEHILDDSSRELLKYGFKKVAKKNDFIRTDEIGDAFRHSGQNPSEDIVKDLIDKAKKLKESPKDDLDEDEKPDDHLSFPDFMTIIHEYWIAIDYDKQQLQDAFDTLDPDNKSRLMIDDFVHLLRNCDWPEEEIELILSQVTCSDGNFLHSELQKILITPIELSKKKSAKSKGKKKAK